MTELIYFKDLHMFGFVITEQLLFVLNLLFKCRKRCYHQGRRQNLLWNQLLQQFAMVANLLQNQLLWLSPGMLGWGGGPLYNR